jgi:nucleoside-diphosphate-sugar epimerase
MRVFLAGASGAIGRRLVPILIARGHQVIGMTRYQERAEILRAQGVKAVVVDVFDAESLGRSVVEAGPEVVVHQLTDLAVPDASLVDNAVLTRNAHVRKVGTRNLVAATAAVRAQRLVAQSVAWLYGPGTPPYAEDDPLVPLTPASPITDRGIYALEEQVLGDKRFDGLVLRYGRLYGPGTWSMTPPVSPAVHVDAAAWAAALAVERGAPGAYNVVDDGAPVANAKARIAFGWSPDWRAANLGRF